MSEAKRSDRDGRIFLDASTLLAKLEKVEANPKVPKCPKNQLGKLPSERRGLNESVLSMFSSFGSAFGPPVP